MSYHLFNFLLSLVSRSGIHEPLIPVRVRPDRLGVAKAPLRRRSHGPPTTFLPPKSLTSGLGTCFPSKTLFDFRLSFLLFYLVERSPPTFPPTERPKKTSPLTSRRGHSVTTECRPDRRRSGSLLVPFFSLWPSTDNGLHVVGDCEPRQRGAGVILYAYTGRFRVVRLGALLEPTISRRAPDRDGIRSLSCSTLVTVRPQAPSNHPWSRTPPRNQNGDEPTHLDLVRNGERP